MSLYNALLHWVTHQWCNRYRVHFTSNSNQLEATQKCVLRNLLRLTQDAPAHAGYGLSIKDNWQTLAEKVPVTDYKHWQPWIQKSQVNLPGSLCNSPIQRHQPTSGSTSAIKWIPYSKQFLSEINAALMPWIGELYHSHPGIRRGYHYWSVSWIPTSLRDEVDENVNDDLKVLPWWERRIATPYMAVPESVAQAKSLDDTLFASLAWLVARSDLSFLSVWSPTFALTLIEQLNAHREELIEVLNRGEWLSRAKSLRFTICPKAPARAALLGQTCNATDPDFLAELWPNLCLISCWDTSSSRIGADALSKIFPYARMEGKGVWATEGAVTIPFAGKYPLAINSHYYEFLDIDSNTTIPSWKLEKGMNVSPILSTGSGFLRYKLNDRLLVTDFLNQTPCFVFLGRMDCTDMAGEKLSSETAQTIIDHFRVSSNLNPITLLAISGQVKAEESVYSRSRYVLLCEPGAGDADSKSISAMLETMLSQHFHYQLARELNQLDSACVLTTAKANEIYHFRCKKRGMSEGNIKIEPLILWDTEMHPTLLSSLQQQCNHESLSAAPSNNFVFA